MQKHLRAAGISPNALPTPIQKRGIHYIGLWMQHRFITSKAHTGQWLCHTGVRPLLLWEAHGLKAWQVGSPRVERRTWSTWGTKWTDLPRGREGTQLLYFNGGEAVAQVKDSRTDRRWEDKRADKEDKQLLQTGSSRRQTLTITPI